MGDSRWKEMVEKNTILRVLVGSQAYGLSLEDSTSDRDEKGVCIEPLEVHLGFNRFEQLEYRTAAEREGRHDAPSGPGDLDLTIYSLKKFLNLALKGNPTIIEMLFIQNHIQTNALGYKLQELAPKIVSKQCGKAFLGYLQAQRQRLLGERGGKDVNRAALVEKYGYDVKYAAHMVRLGAMGVELLKTGKITMPMVGSERDFILDIRQGKVSEKKAVAVAEYFEEELKALVDGKSELPDHADQAYIEDWMINRYWQWWKGQRVLLDRLPIDMIQ